jgi:hypothetical protein
VQQWIFNFIPKLNKIEGTRHAVDVTQNQVCPLNLKKYDKPKKNPKNPVTKPSTVVMYVVLK